MNRSNASIKEKITEIKKQIPASVSVLAATKGRTLSEAQAAISAGISILGENYVQEAEKKYLEVKERGKFLAQLHLIGHLQKNKVKKALAVFDMIQTVDSYDLALEISKRAEKPFPILIQVNIGREGQKFGCLPEETMALVEKISLLENIRVMGLMAMAPHTKDPKDAGAYFKEMKALFDNIHKEMKKNNKKSLASGMKILSMGMSHDYLIATKEGATMIRLGDAIFGPRK